MGTTMTEMKHELVSIIICVRNSEPWLADCLESIAGQTYKGAMEISIYDDGSSDRSMDIIERWYRQLDDKRFTLIISSNSNVHQPRGVGYAKNCATRQSHGQYLCFFDSDDIMSAERVTKQLQCCGDNVNAIVGSLIRRIPEDSTPRYVDWTNNLSHKQLALQIFTCFGPTILMPTWFCHRQVFDRVGGFDQSATKGVPEDLIFFYRHLELGGQVKRVDEVLLTYRYHPTATTFSVTDQTIWSIRLAELETKVLSKLDSFTIWNAGKEGRRLFRSLSVINRNKVIAFCDVDEKKISKQWYTYERNGLDSEDRISRLTKGVKPKVPICHFRSAHPPFIICLKFGLFSGNLDQHLDSLDLKEGIDYVYFG